MREWIETVAIALASLATCITFFIALVNYKLMLKQKKVELYEGYRQKMKENLDFQKITSMLENDEDGLREIPIICRYQFLGFYEDISILIKNKLMNPYVAHYMFAYFALRCGESKNFWFEINRESIYWKEFNDFVDEMNAIEKSREISQKKYGEKLKI